MNSFHITIRWNHIDLHFGTKDYCNLICIIFIYKLFLFNKNKNFLTQFELYTLLKFIFIILKIQVSNLSIYLCLQCFSSSSCLCQLHLQNNFKMCIFTYFIIFFEFFKYSYEFWINIILPTFVKKYPSIFLRYFWYIHKIKIPIYSWLSIFSSLLILRWHLF